jgi:tetratricopeptide (TPR) repeat protein
MPCVHFTGERMRMLRMGRINVPSCGPCRYRESINACEQVLSLNPQHYLALSGKGLCHFYLNERKEAEACWKEALKINPFLTQFRRFLSASETGEL